MPSKNGDELAVRRWGILLEMVRKHPRVEGVIGRPIYQQPHH